MAREAARAELGIGRDEFVAGWVGRLSAEKGPDVMVDAVSVLAPMGIRFSMVGDGRLGDALRRRAAMRGVTPYIRWHGVVPEAARYLPAFDVLTLSSRTEGTPIVLFEAMAAGVPVVATAVGGIPDVVSDREALLVPPGDLAALTRAILQVRDDPVAAEIRATQARERLGHDFAAGPWIERHLAIYRTMTRGIV